MDKAKAGRVKDGSQGWVKWGLGGSDGVKIETTVLEQQ